MCFFKASSPEFISGSKITTTSGRFVVVSFDENNSLSFRTSEDGKKIGAKCGSIRLFLTANEIEEPEE